MHKLSQSIQCTNYNWVTSLVYWHSWILMQHIVTVSGLILIIIFLLHNFDQYMIRIWSFSCLETLTINLKHNFSSFFNIRVCCIMVEIDWEQNKNVVFGYLRENENCSIKTDQQTASLDCLNFFHKKSL